jgi:ubiquinone/menaquinone biosynthesis C-methylase UbiE
LYEPRSLKVIDAFRFYVILLGPRVEVDGKMYVCCRCKGPLAEYKCSNCQLEFRVIDGIPCFLTDTANGNSQKLREIYDGIYRDHEDVWIGQGRSEQFLQYFRDLSQSSAADDVLEIGCGEGMLLAALAGRNKYGVDPSVHALRRARRRSAAEYAIARAEELPFAEGHFDLVVTVGVMEHFQDPDAATAEIRRVLRPSGRYIALIETDMTLLERLVVKARMYLWPRFRPIDLLTWASRKLRHRIVQPFRRSYTIDTARQCLERNGFEVMQAITHKTHPSAPLAGDHVVILTARRR